MIESQTERFELTYKKEQSEGLDSCTHPPYLINSPSVNER
ncbi:hypothetical protein PL10110_400018 [Planktothrix agardhii]|nr:hypothetical protein PL10110_400018 [Planktothrix agardhii]